MKNSYFILVSTLFAPMFMLSQIVYTNGATMHISSGATVWLNGGINISNSSIFSNDGDITITKNSTLPLAGSVNIENNSSLSGNGSYNVEQDWINSSIFSAGNSTVKLNGNSQQFITSNNGTITTFNNLQLLGTGIGVNRKKTLQGVDAKIGTNGSLSINDRELETQTHSFFVLNPSFNVVTNNAVPGNEGFVSSITPGVFSRETNSNSVYLFPTGSSAGVLRYRPVELTPANTNSNAFTVRMNNVDASTQGFNRLTTDGKECDLNSRYFHSINRSSGTAAADIRLFFIIASDSNWTGIGQWQTGNAQWNDINAAGVGVSGIFNTRTRAAWNFTNNGDPYILTNERPQTPILNCPSICENSTNNMFTLSGNSSSYQWTLPSNGSIINGQGTATISASWSSGSSSVSAIAIGTNGCNSLPGICIPTIVPPPSVQFTHMDDFTDISFIDQTSNASQWNWDFGDGTNSNSQNPTHTYTTSGTYTVLLSVTNSAGCTNSIFQVIEILNDIIIPNVITPNGDGVNDFFTIKTFGLKEYELTIWNRWGSKVFSSSSATIHWDGKVNGNPAPDGVYFYILNAHTSNKQLEFHGNVTVFN